MRFVTNRFLLHQYGNCIFLDQTLGWLGRSDGVIWCIWLKLITGKSGSYCDWVFLHYVVEIDLVA